eukprot:6204398-Pleurochrysis_carterae.AAC.3
MAHPGNGAGRSSEAHSSSHHRHLPPPARPPVSHLSLLPLPSPAIGPLPCAHVCRSHPVSFFVVSV